MIRDLITKTGNEVVAYAMGQINPDVVAAYPITPATEIVQIFSHYVADGKVDTEFILTESEHSAISACVGASAAGARTMTATSSQGLALMYEILNIASGLRLPIVMAVANRALSAPINIHGDQSDTFGVRDCGWIQIYSENVQEVYDNFVQAVRIAESTYLPVMVTMDGFILTHCLEQFSPLKNKEVKDFIGQYKPEYSLLNTDQPITIGALDLQDYYFEHKRGESEAVNKAGLMINKVGQEFGRKFGRKYGFFEKYRLEDAEMGIIVVGSTAGTAKDVVDELREKKLKVGLLKLRVFRPFPYKELVNALKNLKYLAVLDKADSYSSFGGPLFHEVRSALYDLKSQIKIVNYIYGLGGRDVDYNQIKKVFNDLEKITKAKKVKDLISYLGVR
jgi:pyruvate ferredoxin oxidoreductase alpha subunit